MSAPLPNFTNLVTTTQKAAAGAVDIYFSWVDHSIFVVLLGVSIFIGVWFGFCGKKEDNTREYLFGGKTMGVVPTALSLTASCISGTTLLGVPTDIYLYGTSYWMGTISIVLVCLTTAYVYLPVFEKLQLTSSYEYFGRRFGPKLRRTISGIAVFKLTVVITLIIYTPALAFSQVTGINVHIITPIVCVICIFYTTVGGLKAVVWTDAIQLVGIFAGCLAVFYFGITATGGIAAIWKISDERGRIDFFNMDPDPTLRNSFWSTLIGVYGFWLNLVGINQASVQRFLSVPSPKDARKALIVFAICLSIINSLCCFIGLIIFARYADCDPISTKVVKRPDQLLPYFVMDVAGHVYGLPGIFIAGVFSAALSTMSTVLNSLAAVVYEDFVSNFVSENISEKKVNTIMKIIVVALGLFATAMVSIIEKLGGILQLVLTLAGLSAGPVVGLFTLGMLCPAANSPGAVVGSLSSVAIMTTIFLGSQYHIAQKNLVYPPLSLSTDQCDFPIGALHHGNSTIHHEPHTPFILFRISYYYYTVLGALLVIVIGLPISYWTRKKTDRVHPDLLSPVVHWLLPKERRPPPDYKTVEQALQHLKENGEKIDVY